MNRTIRALKEKLGKRKKSDIYPLRIFKEFEDSLNLIEDFDQIAGNFLGKIKEVCPVHRVILFIYDSDTGKFRPSASFGVEDRQKEQISFSRASRLVKWLKVNQTFLNIPQRAGVLEYLTQKETETLKALGIEVCFPLMSMNRLIGILLVGTKESGKPFSRQEISFISSFLPQTGIALENALLFKEHRERFRRMSRADKLATIGELAAGAALSLPPSDLTLMLIFVKAREDSQWFDMDRLEIVAFRVNGEAVLSGCMEKMAFGLTME